MQPEESKTAVRAYKWQFTEKTGERHFAMFTDEEIEDMKIRYPEVRWQTS